MKTCGWCGKASKTDQYGYCEQCTSVVRSEIIQYKARLEELLKTAHIGSTATEKATIMAEVDQICKALLVYKQRNVPFFKSDVSELRGNIENKFSLQKTDFFVPLQIDGRASKSIILDKNSVRIIRKGSLLAATREKTIPIKQISGVEIKKPGALVVGFIQIQTAGQHIASSSYSYTGGAADALKDENSLLFAKPEDYETALNIKKYIENYSDAAPVVVSHSGSVSVADEILKLKSLLDSGVITLDAFETQKAKLLG